MASQPKQPELLFHIDEIGWSLVSMCRHMVFSRAADMGGRADEAQAAFDGAVLHVRAIVEFLSRRVGAQVRAASYCSAGWDSAAAAAKRKLDLGDLYDELSTHAIHLSRLRFRQRPSQAWDLVPRIDALLGVFEDFVHSADQTFQQPLWIQLTDARTQFARIPPFTP